MAGSTATKAKHYPNPADTDKMVDFYLERQQFMDPAKEYSIPVTVNGYEFHATFGKRNRLPKSVVEVLKNAKSAIHPTLKGAQVEMARGGEGRDQSRIFQSEQSIQYINDYNVVEEKEV